MSDEPVFARRLGLLADHIEAGYHVSREVTVNLLRRAASAERANVLESQRDLLRRTLELCMAERDTAQVKVERLLGEVKRANHLAADARAERDTAQASEARLREAAQAVVDDLNTHGDYVRVLSRHDAPVKALAAALASTPNPEERPWNSPESEAGPLTEETLKAAIDGASRHPAPDPTPEPEGGTS